MEHPFINPKLVSKPWGHELWIADGQRTPYALKRITFNAGHQSSLQVHKFKFETNFVLSGTGFIQLKSDHIDIDDYLISNDQNKLDKIIKSLITVPIEPGNVIDVHPGQVHRVIAKTDIVFIEASTVELDDVYRLADDSNRPHGKINKEHDY
jgi:mannose-6-phosphate isomerase-like protein (cupin superfamily)